MGRVLIVDDHVELCRPLVRLFRIDGHDAECALSGEEALAKLFAATGPLPDLVLLDYMMPGMDGLTVLQRLQDDVRTAAVPVVMLTAMNDPAVAQAALGGGAREFLVKNVVDYARLRLLLAKYLAPPPPPGTAPRNLC